MQFQSIKEKIWLHLGRDVQYMASMRNSVTLQARRTLSENKDCGSLSESPPMSCRGICHVPVYFWFGLTHFPCFGKAAVCWMHTTTAHNGDTNCCVQPWWICLCVAIHSSTSDKQHEWTIFFSNDFPLRPIGKWLRWLFGVCVNVNAHQSSLCIFWTYIIFPSSFLSGSLCWSLQTIYIQYEISHWYLSSL